MLRMELMSMISSLLAAQAGNVRTQIAATILKANADAEKSTVLTLLGAAQQDTSSLANVGAGIGGNLNITAQINALVQIGFREAEKPGAAGLLGVLLTLGS